jgi:ferredoxin-NADP reductase
MDFRFVRTDGERLEYKPGQFYRFVFTDDEGEFERSYSLCNYEELFGTRLDLVISRVAGGRATNLLFNCEKGLTATVTGPFGRLVVPDELPKRLVMVATSVGIAPYMPMLRQIETNDSLQVVFLFGARDRSEFLYADELLAYRAQHAQFDLRVCYSRESDSLADHEYPGYVTTQLESLNLDTQRDHCLLCGNPMMIDDAWAWLRDREFKAKQVVREKYVFAKEKKSSVQSLTAEQKRLIAEKMQKYQR